MTWQHKELGHQQQYYWIYQVVESWISVRKDFDHLHYLTVETDGKLKYRILQNYFRRKEGYEMQVHIYFSWEKDQLKD